MNDSENFVNQSDEYINSMHFMYDNRNFSWKITSIFIISYALVVIPGLIANVLIFMAVVKKPILMTPLNILISNLALSDCLLCIVNVPSTLIEICCMYWPLGDHDSLCKFFGLSQGLLIFVSTITIVVIAVDRYQIMFYPTEKKLTESGAVKAIFFIWILSFGLASPLCLMRKLKNYEYDLPELKYVMICEEDWPDQKGRTYYSIFSLVIQYLLPFVVVSYTYAKIYLKVNRGNSMARQERERERRLKKTNSLLVAMALAHCVSWLPLNTLNLIGDLYEDHLKDISEDISKEVYLVSFFLCHLIGMSTVITNPLLYGYYNDNFRKACLEMAAFKFLKKTGYVSDIPYTVDDEGGESNMVRLTDNTLMSSVCKTNLSQFYKKKLNLDTGSVDDTSV